MSLAGSKPGIVPAIVFSQNKVDGLLQGGQVAPLDGIILDLVWEHVVEHALELIVRKVGARACNHVLPFATVIGQGTGITALRKAVRGANVRELYLLVAPFVGNNESPSELEAVEFVSSGDGCPIHHQVAADVRTDGSMHVLGGGSPGISTSRPSTCLNAIKRALVNGVSSASMS